MKQKEITIAGKKVTLAYCYATEISYRDFTGEDFQKIIVNLNTAGEDDPKKLIYAILSCALAYYNSKGEECPLIDEDLLYRAKPEDIVTAFAAVMELHNAWYKIPKGEPKPVEPKNGKGKKGKN